MDHYYLLLKFIANVYFFYALNYSDSLTVSFRLSFWTSVLLYQFIAVRIYFDGRHDNNDMFLQFNIVKYLLKLVSLVLFATTT